MTRSTTAGGDHLIRDATVERDRGRGRDAASAALGGTLLIAGLRRRSLGGMAMALAGGWLVYRAVRRRGRRSDPEGADRSTEHREIEAPSGPTEVERSVTVRADADELYRYWRDSDLLSQIVGDFAEVGVAGEDRHRWTVPTPLGRSLEWETELVEDRPGEFLRWKSAEGAMVTNEGSVRFRQAPADRGTEVTLTLQFDPPGGRVGRTAMELLGVVPETLANKMLYRFKSLAETGEIPTLEKNPSARGSGDLV